MNKKLYTVSWVELKNRELNQPKLIHNNKKSLRLCACTMQRSVGWSSRESF